jgi:hypothetical protein
VSQFNLPPAEYLGLLQSAAAADLIPALFRHQYDRNPLYREYVDLLRVRPERVREVEQIPFLPIGFFKTHEVLSGVGADHELLFESSRTTGDRPSRHLVRSAALYEQALIAGFEERFGPLGDWTILALLPSYMERKTASLVHMAETMMRSGAGPESGFYLNELEVLRTKLQTLRAGGKKVLLLGVTFALLDFAEAFPMDLSGVTVMETGGMKGRREEWTRAQVHDLLKSRWNLSAVATEYGMTELLSQAYGTEDGLLSPAFSMRVLVRDVNDPLEVRSSGTGVLNIVDLANLHSCAFIATEDLGTVYEDSSFEVLGRMDHSALRGCSLMTIS